MCLILFGYRTDPDRRLVVAANRDEFYERRTEGIHRWADLPIIAGRDFEAGGTWMGVSTVVPGRFAAVTNVRIGEPKAMPDKRSRGNLPVDFLVGEMSAADYAARLIADADRYAPVNLLVADDDEMWWATNAPEPAGAPVQPGVHGLSNGSLDSDWPKVTDGAEALAGVLADPAAVPEDYLAVLTDRSTADDSRLPVTGVPPEQERSLSARFIQMSEYGTRASTLLTIDADGRGAVTEWRFNSGSLIGSTELTF